MALFQRKSKWVIFLAVLLISSLTATSQAEGLKLNNYAEVFIENLGIGNTYSMKEIGNLPLELTNTGENKLTVNIEAIQPSVMKTKPDFEPIPDAVWVTIKPKTVDIEGKAIHSSDVVLTIPDDPKYLGKKYHVDIKATAAPKKGFMPVTFAVKGRLLFSTAATKESAGKAAKGMTSLNFEIKPERIDMIAIPLGKKIKVLSKDKRFITIKNKGNEKAKIVLQSIDPKETVMKIKTGFETTPNPDFLILGREELTLNKNQKKDIAAFIKIPDKPEYKDKKYEFIIVISTGKGGSGARYIPVSITTAK